VKHINVAVIGSGSTYTPELVDGLMRLSLRRIALMDIDERKRTIVGNLCKRQLQHAGVNCEVVITASLDEALQGADFVVTQIRVGGLAARHLDESIPLKHGLIGQETTGIGGFFKAMRTIPAMAEICAAIERICPQAWLINFTNPSGIITEFVLRHTQVKCIGLCNAPVNMLHDAGAQPQDYVGLNHLSWVTKPFTPSYYLEYYDKRDEKLAEQQAAEQSRAQECTQIEEELLALYQDENLREKPGLLDKRGGAKYSLAAVQLIEAIAQDKQDIQVVNVRNAGTLPFLQDDDVIEIACVIGKNGATPLAIAPCWNDDMVALMQQVKAYEKLTVDAAVKGADNTALLALQKHPLIGGAAHLCYREMKAAHWAYLPQFYGDNTQLFSGKAQAYAAARPGYPAEALDYIASLLPKQALLADIGAGTGKFTQLLAERGYIVHAVEPNVDMRAQLVPHENIRVVATAAEDTGLPAQSVDAITVAQALHWFDLVAFMAECKRIAKPGAPVIVIYNNTPGGDSNMHSRLSTDVFFCEPTVRDFANPIDYTRESWAAYRTSHSHDPRPGDANYDEHMMEVHAQFDRENVNGILRKEVITRVYHDHLRWGSSLRDNT